MTSTSSFAPLDSPQSRLMRLLGHFFFIPHRGIVNRPVEEHFEHLQQFQFSHDLDGAVHNGLALQEFPEILFSENDGLNDFTERNALAGAPDPDFAITVLDVELVLASSHSPRWR